jgi:cysteinyl-tRNA synthetase
MNLPDIRIVFLCCFLLIAPEYIAQNIEKKDYRQEMRSLVVEISRTAKAKDKDFLIVPQNGVELILIEPSDQKMPASEYLDAIDGLAQEDLFFGYPEFNDVTPLSDNLYLKTYLHLGRKKGKKILITDYGSSPGLRKKSYKLNEENDFTPFVAPTRELDQIPNYPIYKENRSDITDLSEAQNFLYLLNFSEYSSKQDLITELKFTNYDLIILDLFFEDKAFTNEEIRQLKQKKNGGSRLVLAYMSIGEAEDYRFYWKDSWNYSYPKWIVEENPDWKGNFKVTYWNPDWKKIIYENQGSYLEKILDSGFDGIYLDIIDGYLYFENNN